MQYSNIDKVKPLDELLNENIREFESGRDRLRDKDLDEMIWELDDLENEEPLQEANEFKREVPTEEELVEKGMKVGRRGKTSFTEKPVLAESSFMTADFATASSIGSETPKRKTRISRCAQAARPTKTKHTRMSPSRKKK